MTGYVDENQLNYLGGFPGDGLKDLFGVISEEIDTLYPSDRNRVHFAEMPEGEVRDYAEVLRVADGTNVLVPMNRIITRNGSSDGAHMSKRQCHVYRGPAG